MLVAFEAKSMALELPKADTVKSCLTPFLKPSFLERRKTKLGNRRIIQRIKWIAFFVLCLAVSAALFAIPALADCSGTCGDDVTWTFTEADGTLTISGTGPMASYSYSSSNSTINTPWYSLRSQIRSVVISDGVMSVGNYAFAHCGNLEEVSIPESVVGIGEMVFSGCDGLPTLTIPSGVTWLELKDCTGLSTLNLPEGLTYLRLDGAGNLKSLDLPEGLQSIRLYNTGIEEITLPDSLVFPIDSDSYLSAVASAGFAGSPISAFHVKATNPNYQEINGFLYSKDEKILVACPLRNLETSYTVPEGVETIGPNAFSRTNITELTLPSTLKTICEKAFMYSSVRSIRIPENVEEMGRRAFDSSSIAEVVFDCPNLEIPAWAFVSCRKLSYVSLPRESCVIGTQAFAGCELLKSIDLSSVTSVGSGAFIRTGLKSAAFPTDTYLGTYTYITSGGIQTVQTPQSFGYSGIAVDNNVPYYDHVMYYANSKISGFVIYGLSGSHAETYASKCGFTFVALDGGETSPGDNDSDDTDEENDTDDPTNSGNSENQGPNGPGPSNPNSHTGANSGSGDGDPSNNGENGNTNPSTPGEEGDDGDGGEGDGDANDDADGDGQTSSGSGCKVGTVYHTWRWNEERQKWVCSVCHATFVEVGDCGDSLQYVVTGNAQDGYRLYVYGEGSMTDFAGPLSVPWSAYSAHLKRVYLPSGLTRIGNNAFYGCGELTGLQLPSSLTKIGDYAFKGCSALRTITLPGGLTAIGNECFMGCSALETAALDSSLTALPTKAFANCIALQKIAMPASLTTTGTYAFMNCLGLEEITLPAQFTELGYGTFYGCENLAQITLSDALTAIPTKSFFGCVRLSSVELPLSCVSIGANAFENCVSLRLVTIPETVRTISESAFLNSSNSLCITCHQATAAATFAAEQGKDTNLVHFYESGICRFCGDVCAHADGDDDQICDLCGLTLQLSGSCGDNAAFQLVERTAGSGYYTLALSGTGALWDFSEAAPAPWHGYAGVIDEITMGGITRIGDYAFAGFTALQELDLGSGILSVGDMAFSGCTALERLTVHPETTTLAESAFAGCDRMNVLCHPGSNAHQFALDNDLWYMPVHFRGDDGYCTECDVFVYVNETNSYAPYMYYKTTDAEGKISYTLCFYGSGTILGNGDTTKIPWYGLRNNCSDIYFSRNITAIDDYAFYSFSALTSIRFPEGLLSIGSYAFRSCNKIASLTFPASLQSIGSYAFGNCNSITSLYLPNTLTSIGQNAFSSCSGLTNLELQEGIGFNSSGVFSSCTKLVNVTLPDSLTVLPSSTFSGCTTLKQIQLPEDLTAIGSYAFNGCSLLEDVTIPEGATLIGAHAFDKCKKLSSITIPASVTSIGSYAFNNCTGLTSLSIPAGVTTIEEGTFYNCTGLTSLTLPPRASTIGAYAFYSCSNLQSLTLPEDIESIGASAFESCNQLQSLILPADITSIGSRAFYGCTGLTSLTLPEDLTSVGAYAFYNCTGLTALEFPEGLTSVGAYAFYNCTGLTALEFPEGLTVIGERAFYYCTALETLTLPESLTTIGERAFAQCSALREMTIPSRVAAIPSYAFANCSSLEQVVIPVSVTSIGTGAFSEATCKALTDVYYGGTEAQWTSIEISDYNTQLSIATIHYHEHSFGEPVYTWTEDCSSCTATRECSEYSSHTETETVQTTSEITKAATSTEMGETTYTATFSNPVFQTQTRTVQNIPALGVAIVDSGTCGDGLTWTLDEEGGLTISGVGPMTDYSNSRNTPWYAYGDILRSVVIESGVTSIGECAFEYMGMFNLSIADSVVTIGEYAFYNCEGLTSVTIPGSVTSIGEGAFASCFDLTEILVAEDNPAYCSIYGVLFSKDGTLLHTVPMGRENSFTIPDGVTRIAARAFEGSMLELGDLTLPSGLLSIGDWAFSDCVELTGVELPGSLTAIGEGAFYGCEGLTSVTIPGGVTSIPARVFENCTSLETLVLNHGVASAEEDSFYGCPIKYVTIPPSFKDDGLHPGPAQFMYLLGTGTQIEKIYVHADVDPESADEYFKPRTAYADKLEYIHFYGPDGMCVFPGCAGACAHGSFSNEVIEPTCTEGGYTLHICDLCGHSVQDTPTEPLGHSWDVGVWMVLREDAEYIYSGYRYTCARCGETRDEEEMASIKDTGNTGGTVEPIKDENLKFSAASLEIKDNISIDFKAKRSLFENDGFSNPYAVFTKNGEEVIERTYTIKGDYYVFTMHNIAPNEMNDTVTAVLYATGDGVSMVEGKTTNYGVSRYCYNQLAKLDGATAEKDLKLQTLLVDLLNFGAKAQIYTNHNTDNLANAALTETQRDWGTTTTPTYSSQTDTKYHEVSSPKARWSAVALELQETVQIRYKLTLLDETIDLTKLMVRVTDENGREWDYSAEDLISTSGGYYLFFRELGAERMRDPVFATIYLEGEAISNTLRYSIESYAYSKQNDSNTSLVEMLSAMICYGDAAYSYTH